MKQKKKITKTKKTIKRGCKKQPTKTVSKKKNVLKNKNKSTKKVKLTKSVKKGKEKPTTTKRRLDAKKPVKRKRKPISRDPNDIHAVLRRKRILCHTCQNRFKCEDAIKKDYPLVCMIYIPDLES